MIYTCHCFVSICLYQLVWFESLLRLIKIDSNRDYYKYISTGRVSILVLIHFTIVYFCNASHIVLWVVWVKRLINRSSRHKLVYSSPGKYFNSLANKMPAQLYSCNEKSQHCSEIINSTLASQITSVFIVCSTVCLGIDQRKHQSSVSLVFVRRIHRASVNSPHKRPVTRKMFPDDDVIMVMEQILTYLVCNYPYSLICALILVIWCDVSVEMSVIQTAWNKWWYKFTCKIIIFTYLLCYCTRDFYGSSKSVK